MGFLVSVPGCNGLVGTGLLVSVPSFDALAAVVPVAGPAAGFPVAADDFGGAAIAAGVFTAALPGAASCPGFATGPAGFLVATEVPPGPPAPGDPEAPGALGAFASGLGMLGKRWESISAARMGTEPEATDEWLSPVSVMTSTSSRRRRSA